MVKKNAVTRLSRSGARSAALDEKKGGSKEWKQITIYSVVLKRLLMDKTVFQEYVAAKTYENMVHETLMKVCVCNMLAGMERGVELKILKKGRG
jgi:hypothetical protein